MTAGAESAPPRKRRNPKGEARREHILDVARTIFSEGGYHSASIADIAARAGISQAGLLHHFPSKPEILLAVLNARDLEDNRKADDQPAGVPYLNHYIRVLDSHASDPALLQLNAMISAEAIPDSHPAHDYMVRLYRERLEGFTAALEGTFDTDAMPDGVTTTTIARWIMALSEGLRLQMLYEEEPLDRARILTEFLQTLSAFVVDKGPITPDSDA
ncbi:TetR/AcrR family transcriptional regulator [Microbacterium sp. NPDC057944]|uniref:TetR/AcrR family transcriptional regulator n=1 Tax=Microbacterium sp. NPDC057944 TaxID=3346286 RepID=UPI0036DF6905